MFQQRKELRSVEIFFFLNMRKYTKGGGLFLHPLYLPYLLHLICKACWASFHRCECLQGGVNKACMTIHIQSAEDSSFALRLGVQKPLNGK